MELRRKCTKETEKKGKGALGGKGEGHEGMVGSGDNDIDNGWAQELQISSIIRKMGKFWSKWR